MATKTLMKGGMSVNPKTRDAPPPPGPNAHPAEQPDGWLNNPTGTLRNVRKSAQKSKPTDRYHGQNVRDAEMAKAEMLRRKSVAAKAKAKAKAKNRAGKFLGGK